MDPKAMLWHRPPPPARKPAPGELLFEFIRKSDRASMSCELRFHGESFGWEAQFLERGELRYAHGGFLTQADAIAWTEEERKALERPVITGHRRS